VFARARARAPGNFIIPGDKVGLYEAIVPREARSSRCQTVYLFCVFTSQRGIERVGIHKTPRRLALSILLGISNINIIRLKEARSPVVKDVEMKRKGML